MRALLTCSILLAAGCAGHHEGHGPAGIPYACTDGRPARILYEGGGWHPRGRATLLFDGRTIELVATPPTYGLRYVTGEHHDGPTLVWTARGEEALLTEIADDHDGERDLARCTRVRSGGDEEAADAHH